MNYSEIQNDMLKPENTVKCQRLNDGRVAVGINSTVLYIIPEHEFSLDLKDFDNGFYEEFTDGAEKFPELIKAGFILHKSTLSKPVRKRYDIQKWLAAIKRSEKEYEEKYILFLRPDCHEENITDYTGKTVVNEELLRHFDENATYREHFPNGFNTVPVLKGVYIFENGKQVGFACGFLADYWSTDQCPFHPIQSLSGKGGK